MGNTPRFTIKAGLMVRVNSSNWLKRGLEFVDRVGHARVVLAPEFSYWSTIRGLTTKEAPWWRIVRKGSSLEVFGSLDGHNFISTRLGYLPMPASLDVMCCSPEGAGFESTFDQIRFTH